MNTLTSTRADLLRALAVFAEQPGPEHSPLAELLGLPVPTGSDWTEAFVVQLVPHASIYLSTDGMLGGEAADRVAGFWRALRLPVPADADHVTALLGLYASLTDAVTDTPGGPRKVLYAQARTALLHEHLLSWLPAYLHAMVDVGPPSYAAWARLLRATLDQEVADAGAPDRLPAHLREMPTAQPDAVLDMLFSPARSGLILTRGHLASVARDSGLGVRLGDRRRILRSLIEQDPSALMARLAELAHRWAQRHRADEPLTGPIARHWADRASATTDLLRTAIREEDDVDS
jgi:hypothetical protein